MTMLEKIKRRWQAKRLARAHNINERTASYVLYLSGYDYRFADSCCYIANRCGFHPSHVAFVLTGKR